MDVTGFSKKGEENQPISLKKAGCRFSSPVKNRQVKSEVTDFFNSSRRLFASGQYNYGFHVN